MFDKRYSFNEAKELYINMLNEKDSEKKKQMREDLITGTIYYVKEYLDKNYPKVESTTFNMEDIYNSAYQAWIELIDDGFFTKVDSFGYHNFLGTKVLSKINEDLPLKETNDYLSYSLEIKKSIVDALYDLIDKEKHRDITDEDIYNTIEKYKIPEKEFRIYGSANLKLVLIIKNALKYIEEKSINDLSKANLIKIIDIVLDNSVNYQIDSLNTIKDTKEDYTEDIAFNNADENFRKKLINDALSTLKDKEIEVIVKRFGLNGNQPKTLEEVAKEMNLSKERIRQIEAKTLRKLRHPSRSRVLMEELYDYNPGYSPLTKNYDRWAIPKTRRGINNKLMTINNDNEIQQLIDERIEYLDRISEEKTIDINNNTIFNNYISELVNYVTCNIHNNDYDNEGVGIIYDDTKPYYDLLKQIYDRKLGIAELFLFEDMFYKAYKYLRKKENNNDLNRYEVYKRKSISNKISIKEISKSNCGSSFETAGLAHNFFKIIALNSSLVLGSKNGEDYAYNLLYLNGYKSNTGVILYDPTSELTFVNNEGNKLYMGSFKILTPSEYDNLINGNNISINFNQSGALYKKYYKALDGYELINKQVSYGINVDKKIQTR